MVFHISRTLSLNLVTKHRTYTNIPLHVHNCKHFYQQSKASHGHTLPCKAMFFAVCPALCEFLTSNTHNTNSIAELAGQKCLTNMEHGPTAMDQPQQRNADPWRLYDEIVNEPMYLASHWMSDHVWVFWHKKTAMRKSSQLCSIYSLPCFVELVFSTADSNFETWFRESQSGNVIQPLALPGQSLWETVHLWWLQLTCWYWGCSSIQGIGLHNSSRREHFQTCQRQSLQKLSSACPAVSFERTEIELPMPAKKHNSKAWRLKVCCALLDRLQF